MSEETKGVVTAASTGAVTTEDNKETNESTNEKVSYKLVDSLDLDTKRKVARYFEVSLPKDKAVEVATNRDLNAAFRDNEIDDSLYESIYLQDEAGGKPAEESDVLKDETGEVEKENEDAKNAAENSDDDSSVDEKSQKILIKMTRGNFHFEAYGYTFTREHPFALVDSKTAEAIVRDYEGFSPAMPSEAEDYYN